jgi:hypothetical protein
LFSINVLHAKMRQDLPRLRRETWSTSKTISGLEQHLWLYIAWVKWLRGGDGLTVREALIGSTTHTDRMASSVMQVS